VIDHRGDEVHVLATARHVRKGQLLRLKWNGLDDAGARAPDGRYRYRVTLQHQGRSIVLGTSVRLDTTPPRPRVTSIGPFKSPGPELLPLPDDGVAEVHLDVPGRNPVVRVYKTSPGPTRLVLQQALRTGQTRWDWNGKTATGRPVSPGTYLVGVETRDQAGNRGLSPALDRRGLPIAEYGATLPGRGGITVRYLGVLPPQAPTNVGDEADFAVDARQQPWTYTVRRVGSSAIVKRGRKTSARLRLHAPGKQSGVYLMQVRTGAHTTTVPFPVQGSRSHAVLVVLPVMTWQGRNPVDDDGDGLPNLLDRGVGAKLGRVYAGDGLPAGFAQRDAPLLTWLDRRRHRYDITTDAALASGRGPRLAGHKGVILRWLPRSLQQQLRAFVRAGGSVATFGVDSLQRQVTLTSHGRMVAPTPAASTDLFGARLRPLQTLAKPTNLVVAADRDIQFFVGTTGSFGPFSQVQELQSLPSAPVASAETEDPQTGRPVIAANKLGKGYVFRFPLPELPGLLSNSDAQVAALLDRTWTLLAH
jgi:hypothetical protein